MSMRPSRIKVGAIDRITQVLPTLYTWGEGFDIKYPPIRKPAIGSNTDRRKSMARTGRSTVSSSGEFLWISNVALR